VPINTLRTFTAIAQPYIRQFVGLAPAGALEFETDAIFTKEEALDVPFLCDLVVKLHYVTLEIDGTFRGLRLSGSGVIAPHLVSGGGIPPPAEPRSWSRK
jgi:hypothetical protein